MKDNIKLSGDSMLSTIQYITEQSDFSFDVDFGYKFEDKLYTLLANDLKPYYKFGVTIKKTPKSRDGGVDIIIRSSVSLTIMGQECPISGKKEIIIYIECKTTDKKILSLDKFAKNILLATEKKNIDYFILVTNSVISPHAFYQSKTSCENTKTKFKLVDKNFLYRYLSKNNYFDERNICCKSNNINICYQTEKKYINGKPGLELYLFLTNPCEKVSKCSIKMITNRNWTLSDNAIEIYLPPHSSDCRKFSILKKDFDGIEEVILEFIIDGSKKNIQIVGTSLEYNFALPFSGQEHRDTYYSITEAVCENFSIKTLCLIGEAGIGKTRIIDESINYLSDRGVECKKIWIEQNDSIKIIQDKLEDIFQSNLSEEKNSLKNIILGSTQDICKRFFVVFEDLHNAPKDFFVEFKELLDITPTVPIFIVLSGRDDYTVYNDSYYSFLDWIEHIQESQKSCIYTRKVTNLSKKDCVNLIKMIINDVPDFIVDKIEKVSKGNPFYLIQYIEYLLETKIVYLVNRNTVGLTNAISFNNNLYIPSKIEEILEMRFKTLCVNYGTKLYDFLKICSYFGPSFPSELFSYYFDDNENEYVEVLLTHHFLKISHQCVMFDHESIYLFLKNLLSKNEEKEYLSSLIYQNRLIYNTLEKIKKGEVLVYVGHYLEARKFLNYPIKELMETNNISSINLDSALFDYYYSIYYLAKKEGDNILMKKTLMAIVYVSMHNLSSGQSSQAFEFVHMMLDSDFKNEDQLTTTILVLQAHHYMSTGQMSLAKKMILDLLTTERVSPELFDDQTRFNLFDRAASLFLQENHIEPAKKYNKLSLNIAKSSGDYKLITLAQIINAKILFLSSPKKAYNFMLQAEKSLNKSDSCRIRCHNDIGKLTAEILLKLNQSISIHELINKAHLLYNESIRVNYPLASIRIKYLLAVLYLLNNNLEMSQKYINSGIETSIRVGIIKLLPHYYNLKLIIAEREEQDYDTILKYANTMLEYLRQQDQLFLGALDFGNSSILNITNYVIFAHKHLPEDECYKFLKELKYYGSDICCDFKCDSHKTCSYSCVKSRKLFLDSLKRIEKGNLLFLDPKYKYKLKDSKTNYFIPLGV